MPRPRIHSYEKQLETSYFCCFLMALNQNLFDIIRLKIKVLSRDFVKPCDLIIKKNP